MQFNEKIIAARKDKHMSQEALAEAVGVSRQAVSKWETGEAKPDLDKLIALCHALDLNIEYLCLDKKQPLQSKGKQPHPAVIAAVLIAEAVLFFLLGIGVSYLCFAAQIVQIPIDTQPKIINQLSVNEIKIVHVNVNTIWNDRDEKQCQISVMTDVIPENLQMKLMVENRSFPEIASSTHDCQKSNNYYIATFPKKQGEYLVTAILNINGEAKQVPLLKIDMVGDAYSYTELWQ